MPFIAPKTWVEVERLYFEGETPLAKIAKRFGMSRLTLHRRARMRGWPKHRLLMLDAASSTRARLRAAILRKLERLENSMYSTRTEGDEERHTRQSTSVERTVAKLDKQEAEWRTKMFTDATPAGSTSKETDHSEKADQIAAWRRAIARRIYRLGQKRNG